MATASALRGLTARARAWAGRARRAWTEQQIASSEPLLEADRSSADSITELLQFGCLVAFANNYVLASMQCVGPSMLPTLGLSGDVVLMWPTAGKLVTPQLGDVVICSSPTDPKATVCKRVAGACCCAAWHRSARSPTDGGALSCVCGRSARRRGALPEAAGHASGRRRHLCAARPLLAGG